MTTLYLVRHGQTDNNLQASFNGCHSNQPLNETGKLQAAALTKEFANKPLDVIYTSPLLRAMMTAEGVRGAHTVPTYTADALHEMDMGILDGVSFEEVQRTHAEVWHNWKKEPEKLRMPGGESFAEAQARVYDAVAEILRRERGKAVAIVAHGTLLSLLTAKLFGFSLAERRKVPYLLNAAYHELMLDGEGYLSPVRLRVTSHLSSELFLAPPDAVDPRTLDKKYFVAELKE